jgi:hypothetical protein
MVVKDPASYLSEDSKQETTAMTIITGRRGALRTFALTMATSAIGLAWGDRPAAAALEPAWMPAGATHLEALKRRLAQAPRRRDIKTVPMILNIQSNGITKL